MQWIPLVIVLGFPPAYMTKSTIKERRLMYIFNKTINWRDSTESPEEGIDEWGAVNHN